MLFEALFSHARETPQETAVIDDSGQYTYAQLAAKTTGLSIYLAGQTQRSHVGILLPSSAAFVASFYGTLLAGKTVVPINFLLGDREIAHVIRDSGIDTVVTVPMLAARLRELPLKVIDLTQLPAAPTNLASKLPNPASDDLAVLMYTSGTSGLPKGVMLSYGNLQSDVEGSIVHAGLQSRHTFLGIIPLFHAFGMTAMMLAPIQLGARIVYTARFSPVATMNAIRQHKASILFGVPSMFGAMLRLENASPGDFAHMYAMISGGEALPPQIREGFRQRFNARIYEGYGLTETSPVVALNTPQWHRTGSVGRTLPGVKVRIADEEGNELPVGQEGEIWLSGPMIMKGYFQLPDDTSAVLTSDSYFKTGDIGKLDADGYLYITGRKKELIIVSAEKVAPREVEEVLVRHPAVAEAAVVGRRDATRGEAVVAFVVLHKDATAQEDELRNFCRSSGLMTFKIPREVIIVPELPRSATGKVLKRVLVDELNSRA